MEDDEIKVTIAQFGADDCRGVRHLVDESETLTHHTTYTYWVAVHEWPELFLVAKKGTEVVGFVFGLRSAEHPERVFLWQIGVLSDYRRRGIAERLLRDLCARAAIAGAREVWATIEADNVASQALFQRFASKLKAEFVERGSTADFGGLLVPEIIYSISLSNVLPD